MNRFCVLLYFEFLLDSISPLVLTWSNYHSTEPSTQLTYDFMMFLTSSSEVVGRDLQTGGNVLK